MTTGSGGLGHVGPIVDAPKAQTAKFRYAFWNGALPLAGKTIADVRQTLSVQWQMPLDAQAYDGKTQLADDYVVQPGDDIEFLRRTGEKGGR